MKDNFHQAQYDLGDPPSIDGQQLEHFPIIPNPIPQPDGEPGDVNTPDRATQPEPAQESTGTDLKSENLPPASASGGRRVCFIGLGSSASALMRELAESASPSSGVFHIALDLGNKEALNPIGNNLLQIHITSDQVSIFENTPSQPTGNLDADITDFPDESQSESQLPGRFQELLSDFDSVYLTGFLGRPSATSLVRVMSAVADSISIPVYGIFTTPLTLEGSARMNVAKGAVESISDHLAQTMIINAQDCFTSLELKPRTPSEFFPHLRSRLLNFHNMVCELQAGTEFIPAALPDFERMLSTGASRPSGFPYIYSGSGSGPDGFAGLLKSFKADKALQKWVDEFRASEIFVFLHGSQSLSCEHVDLLVQSVSIIFPDSQVVVGGSDTLSQKTNLTGGLEDEFRMSLIALPGTSGSPAELESAASSLAGNAASLQPRNPVEPYPVQQAEIPVPSLNEVTDMEYQISSADNQHFASTGNIAESASEESTPLRNERSRQPDFSDVDEDAYLPPPPDIDDELTRKIIHQKKRSGKSREARKIEQIQQQLELAIVSRGRFEGTEESTYLGQDLDIPTYVRLGVDIR